jgi:hypothetical protein
MKIKVTHVHNFESYEMGYWRKMGKIGYKNEVLETGNILHKMKRRKLSMWDFFLDSWSLKVEPKGCAKTSVKNYHYTLRNNPEEGSYRKLSRLATSWGETAF